MIFRIKKQVLSFCTCVLKQNAVKEDNSWSSRPAKVLLLCTKRKHMFYAIRVGLSFTVMVVLLQLFFGEVFGGFIDLIAKMLFVANAMVDTVITNLPQQPPTY